MAHRMLTATELNDALTKMGDCWVETLYPNGRSLRTIAQTVTHGYMFGLDVISEIDPTMWNGTAWIIAPEHNFHLTPAGNAVLFEDGMIRITACDETWQALILPKGHALPKQPMLRLAKKVA